jgi:hypothetical protein
MTCHEDIRELAPTLYADVCNEIVKKKIINYNDFYATYQAIARPQTLLTKKETKKLYDKANSLAQKGRRNNGKIMEDILAKAIDKLKFPHQSQAKIGVQGNHKIDERIVTNNHVFHLSVKTSSRERFPNTWIREQKECEKDAENLTKKERENNPAASAKIPVYCAIILKKTKTPSGKIRLLSFQKSDDMAFLFQDILDDL